jgi:hypothetical protein
MDTSLPPVLTTTGVKALPDLVLFQEVGFERLVDVGFLHVGDVTIGHRRDAAAVRDDGHFDLADLVAIEAGILLTDRRRSRLKRRASERRQCGCGRRDHGTGEQAAAIQCCHDISPSKKWWQ